jgi:hypothetical protein
MEKILEINFDAKKVENLRREYKKAIKADKEFMFLGKKKILTQYAKYLLQHLDMLMGS